MLAALLALSLAAPPAAVDEPAPDFLTSYRTGIVVSDLASVAVLSLGLAIGGFDTRAGETAFLLGAGGLLLGAPLVHSAHGRRAAAAASLLLRLGLPVAAGIGTVFGYAAGPYDRAACAGQVFGCAFSGSVSGAKVGAVVGAGLYGVAVLATDLVVLAREPSGEAAAVAPAGVLLVRLALPAVGLAVGGAIGSGLLERGATQSRKGSDQVGSFLNAFGGGLVGVAAGEAAALLLEAAFFPRADPQALAQLQPSILVEGRRAGVGLTGTF